MTLIASGKSVWTGNHSGFVLLLVVALQAGCSTVQPVGSDTEIESRRVAQLTRDIMAMSPRIIAHEARQVAMIAIHYSRQLADEYDLVSPPLFHNLLVQTGIRKRGLCIHWTEDLKARLAQQNFSSLTFHWAVANYEPLFRFEHSSVVVTAQGAGIEQGLLLDPWRHSGKLYWSMTYNDQGYEWFPREVIRQKKLEKQARQQAQRSQ